jgi:hypothetical protein
MSGYPATFGFCDRSILAVDVAHQFSRSKIRPVTRYARIHIEAAKRFRILIRHHDDHLAEPTLRNSVTHQIRDRRVTVVLLGPRPRPGRVGVGDSMKQIDDRISLTR